jgi:hypothetical protein
MRSIFSGIASVFRSLFGFAFGFLMWPFRLFSGSGGRSPGPNMGVVKAAAQSLTAARAKDSKVAQSTLRESDFRRDAQIGWGWIATTLATRQTMPFPSALSNKMKSWLQGLDYGQLEALRNARAVGICAHVAGTKQITGVPSVKALAPVTLKFPPIAKPAAELSDFRFSLSR